MHSGADNAALFENSNLSTVSLTGTSSKWIPVIKSEQAETGTTPDDLCSGLACASLPEKTPDGRALVRSPSVYFIVFQYFASQFTFFICFSWLLPYLETHYAFSGTRAGLYAAIPLLCGALANWVSGTTVDAIYRKGHRKRSRRLPAMGGFGLACVALVAPGVVRDLS